MKGIVCLNKPSGISSAAAVSKVRRILGVKAAGHMGTLDPMASGVLLIGVGKACRLFDFFLKKEKKYQAVFEFGIETDTLDSTGVVTKSDGRIPPQDEIIRSLPAFFGKIQQIPPQYSAKSVNGQRAYKIAREGGHVELKASEVEIFGLNLIRQISQTAFEFSIHCSSGTYIRSLARDIAEILGTNAIMTKLVRTECGSFSIADAVSIEQLEEKKAEYLISVENTLSDLPSLVLDDSYYNRLVNGVKIRFTDCDINSKKQGNLAEPCKDNKNNDMIFDSLNFSKETQHFLLFCSSELFGIGKIDKDGYIRIGTYLKD